MNKIISDTDAQSVRSLIDIANNIVIFAHISPDGDALGSSLGLYWLLKGIGKNSTVIVPNRFADFLSWMPDSDKIVVALDSPSLAEDRAKEADLMFFADFNTISRINWLKTVASESKANKVLVDHHPNPDIDVTVSISRPDIASASELMYHLIVAMGYSDDIDKNVAECIYTGMMTDTGNFSYNSQSPEIYTIIHNLLKKGINKDEIYNRVYNTYSVDRMQLMGYCLSKKMRIYPAQKAAFIFLTKAECDRFNFKKGDTEGFVSLPFSIDGIEISIFARQDEDKIKISFRSQGSFPINKMAEEFNGGGHRNASGGESYYSMRKTIDKIEKAIMQRDRYEEC